MGLVRVPEFYQHYAVGIKTIGAVYKSIAKYNMQSKVEYWVNMNGGEDTDSSPEKLLVCQSESTTTTITTTPATTTTLEPLPPPNQCGK